MRKIRWGRFFPIFLLLAIVGVVILRPSIDAALITNLFGTRSPGTIQIMETGKPPEPIESSDTVSVTKEKTVKPEDEKSLQPPVASESEFIVGSIVEKGAKSVHNGVQMAIEVVNLAGGVGGKTVTAVNIVWDCTKDGLQSALRSMSSISFVVVGGCESTPLKSQGGKIIMSASTRAAMEGTVFRTIVSYKQETDAMANIKEVLNASSAIVIHDNSPFGESLVNSVRKRFDDLVIFDAIESGLSHLQIAAPDVIFHHGSHEEFVVLKPEIGDSTLVSTSSLDMMKLSDYEGVIIFTPEGNFDLNYERFIALYSSKYQNQPTSQTVLAYDSTRLLLNAVANSDQTISSVKEYLESIHQYAGASGLITFDSNGDIDRTLQSMVIRDGTPALLQLNR